MEKKKTGWTTYGTQELNEIHELNERYKRFLDQGKTERECVRITLDAVREAGYISLETAVREGKSLRPGDKVYYNQMGKALLLFLIGRQMDQQVCNAEYGILLFLTDAHLHNRAILFCDDPMHCKRDCDPLVFFYAPVIMRIQISHFRILIERMLLQVKSRRVDVCAKNTHPFLQRSASYMKQGD